MRQGRRVVCRGTPLLAEAPDATLAFLAVEVTPLAAGLRFREGALMGSSDSSEPLKFSSGMAIL